jgi:hypothetical protein
MTEVNHGRLVDFIEMKERKTAQPDQLPHRTAFNDMSSMVWNLAGDIVLVPDPENLATATRDTLTKISHWSDMEEADIPRLGILTDSFFRFIDEGQDASIVTLWREGTPIIQQIDGEPCEAAVDIVMDAVTGMKALTEKWHGLPPLEAEIEKLAYQKGFKAGHRPKWLERMAREKLDLAEVDEETFESVDRLARFKKLYGGEVVDGKIYRATVNGEVVTIGIDDVGDAFTFTMKGGRQPLVEARPLHATPFTLRDPSSLPERDWLYGGHYIRQYATASVGPGGGGKTAHSISETLAMVTGRPLLDPDGGLTAPLRVWWINCEDPQPEIDRRFHAAAKHFKVTDDQLGGRLFTDSGRDQKFVIARQVGRDLKIVEPFIDEMIEEIERNRIDVVIVDPFVSTHEAQENDNTAMQRVAAAWTEVADRANCGVELVHHVTKGQGEVTADSARGGGAFKDKVRSMRVFNIMTQAEADKAGIEDPRAYFRVDFGKVNMVASGHSQWRRFVSVPLGNGKGLVKTGDEIGVVEQWRWPSADVMAARQAETRRAVVADVPADILAGLKVRLHASDHKYDPKGKPWAGDVVMELTGATDRKAAKTMLDAWIEGGDLAVVELYDASARKPRNFVKPASAPT